MDKILKTQRTIGSNSVIRQILKYLPVPVDIKNSVAINNLTALCRSFNVLYLSVDE
jgi:hypothetical protein